MQDKVAHAFDGVEACLFDAVEYLKDLISDYAMADIDGTTKLGRISALKGKIDYLKGLKFDSRAHPWCDDNA
jgi:hypothetical protein